MYNAAVELETDRVRDNSDETRGKNRVITFCV